MVFWFPDLSSNGVLPWVKIIRMKIRGKSLLLPLSWNEEWVSLLFFLFWAPALLQDPAASSNPQFLCSYFYLRTFVRSFSGHRAHFELFRYLFHLKPQPDSFVLDVVGGAGL